MTREQNKEVASACIRAGRAMQLLGRHMHGCATCLESNGRTDLCDRAKRYVDEIEANLAEDQGGALK